MNAALGLLAWHPYTCAMLGSENTYGVGTARGAHAFGALAAPVARA